jgi:3-dehydroquinate dehydratase II
MQKRKRKGILVLHGPNLNLLGTRQPSIYGNVTLEEINSKLRKLAQKLHCDISIAAHSGEGRLIDAIHNAARGNQAIVINAGAYSHYSYALRDALAAVSVPKIEIHLTNIYAREMFRRRSVIAPVVDGGVFGFGVQSYILAFRAASAMLDEIKD